MGQQHRGIASYERSDTLTGVTTGLPTTLVRLTRDDGYERCPRVEQTPDDRTAILGGGYPDGHGLPWPPTPPPGWPPGPPPPTR